MQGRLPSLPVDKILLLPGGVLQHLGVGELLLDQVGLDGLLVVLEIHLDNGSTNLALRLNEWERVQQPPISFEEVLHNVKRCRKLILTSFVELVAQLLDFGAEHLDVLPTLLRGLIRGNLKLDVGEALNGSRLQLFNKQHPSDRERVVLKEGALHCFLQRRVQRAEQGGTSSPVVDQVVQIVELGLSNSMLSSRLHRVTRIIVNDELHLVVL